MKLGILVTIISGFGKKGFYHSQEIGLAKSLAELGNEIIIYKCVSKSGERKEEEIDSHIRIRYIPVSNFGIHGNCPDDEIDPDLDGLLSFADTQLFLPHIYKFCRKNKIVFVPYIGIAHSAQQNTKSIFMDAAFSLTTLRIYKGIPVIAKTDEVREELEKLGVKDCTVCPVGLDKSELNTDFRSVDRAELRKQYGYSPDDVVISFIARLKVEKRPLELIDLFYSIKEQKKFRLLIVGEGYLKDKMVEKISALGIQDRVTMIDRVPYEKMWEIHTISDYFLNLRLNEIFGMALMEAVYYESSVAAIESAGPKQILDGLEGHRLCRDDQEVKEWLTATYPGKEVLRGSSDRLIEKFSWKHCAGKFIELVQNARG